MSLTKTQLAVLFLAARRPDRGIELPPHIKGASARTFVGKLLQAGLIEDIRALGSLPVWRRDERGAHALRLSRGGLKELLGQSADMAGSRTSSPRKPAKGTRKGGAKQRAHLPREGGNARVGQRRPKNPSSARSNNGLHAPADVADPVSRPVGPKQARMIALLSRPEGATIHALTEATGWQQHSVRGFFAGVVRKKLGLELISTKTESGRIYRIVNPKTPKPKGLRSVA